MSLRAIGKQSQILKDGYTFQVFRLLRQSLRSFLAMTFVVILLFAEKILADTTSVVSDSIEKPFSPPDKGPLGIDISTGLALYGMAILFAVLVVALWRKNIVNRSGNGSRRL